MSNTRVQLSAAFDRKEMCELRQATKDLRQELLTYLAAEAGGKPRLKSAKLAFGKTKQRVRHYGKHHSQT